MTREARMMCGIILITVPTIQYGGYFLLTSLMNKGSGYMDNPFRQNLTPDASSVVVSIVDRLAVQRSQNGMVERYPKRYR